MNKEFIIKLNDGTIHAKYMNLESALLNHRLLLENNVENSVYVSSKDHMELITKKPINKLYVVFIYGPDTICVSCIDSVERINLIEKHISKNHTLEIDSYTESLETFLHDESWLDYIDNTVFDNTCR